MGEEMIEFRCGNCHHRMGAPERYAGRQVHCTKCKAPISIPQPVKKAGAEQAGIIKFRCPTCNQKIGVTVEHAGKRVRCAKCKNPLRVPEAPPQAAGSAVTSETVVPPEEQEQALESEGPWGDLGDMDELRLAEATQPSAELPLDRGPAEYAALEGELPGYAGGMQAPGAFGTTGLGSDRLKKKRPVILIGGACALGVVLICVVVWLLMAGGGTGKSRPTTGMDEVRRFADEYLYLLKARDIKEAREFLSPRLQSSVSDSEIENLARQIGRREIVEFERSQTHFEPGPEGNQFFLLYYVRYNEGGQSLVVLVREVDGDLSIDGTAAREGLGPQAYIGPRDFTRLSSVVYHASFEKASKYFWVLFFVIIVVVLVEVVSWWVVFEKAGQPGWAAIVPIYSMWVLAEVADRPGWWGLLVCFGGAIPCIGPILQVVLMVMISVGVARTFDRGMAFGLGLFFLPFVFYPILAFSND
jgi:DNA-directed RNA polymerase subunit RPC12/RpoP